MRNAEAASAVVSAAPIPARASPPPGISPWRPRSRSRARAPCARARGHSSPGRVQGGAGRGAAAASADGGSGGGRVLPRAPLGAPRASAGDAAHGDAAHGDAAQRARHAQKLEPRPASEKDGAAAASPAVSEREKKEARAVAERERKLEAARTPSPPTRRRSRRRREARRLAAIEAEARAARAEEAAAAARAARARTRRGTGTTPSSRPSPAAPPREPPPRRPARPSRDAAAVDDSARARRQDGDAARPAPDARALRGDARGTRGAQILGDDSRRRAPLGERFVNRMLAGDGGRAPASLSTEEAALLASIRRLDARRLEGDEYTGEYTEYTEYTARADAFTSQRSVEEAALLASLARLDGELAGARRSAARRAKKTAKPPNRSRVRAGDDLSQKRPRSEQHDRSARYVLETEFPAGVKPRPRRPTREPNYLPVRRWTPPDRDAGPVLDEPGARRRRARPVTEPGRLRGPRPLAPLGKKRMNVGYVPPNARAASAREGDARQGQRRRHLGRARHGLFLTIGS